MARLNITMNTFKNLKRNETVKGLSSHLPPLNFITVHYTYIVCTCLLASLIFWGSSDPAKSISYTDSLFLVTSAMTEAGLNTVNLSQMTTFQQFILWFLIVVGSSIFVSISTVLTRKRVFERRFRSVVRGRGRRQRNMGGKATEREVSVERRLGEQRKAAEPVDGREFESRHSGPRDPTARPSIDPGAGKLPDQGQEREDGDEISISTVIGRSRTLVDPDHISVMHYAPSPGREPGAHHHRVLNFAGVGAHPNSTSYKLPHTAGLTHRSDHKSEGEDSGEKETELDGLQYPHYLNRHTTGRNAQFYGLTRAEREHLGGVEYRAITLLSYIVPVYFVLWQLLGCLGLAAYFAHNKADVTLQNGINPWWLGIFNGASAFNNSGMSLLDANMMPFRTSIYPLMTMGIMILAGNTAYPLFLRLIFWTMLKVLCFIYPLEDSQTSLKSTIRFILRYPRRVYTNLFPSAATWWLLFMVITLNGIDWAAFELLNIGNEATEAIPTPFRVLDGLFQALAVRSGGFYIISIPTLRIGLQVLYVIMMYISVYPVVITMRHSNVYEERSLGIYADDDDSSVYDEEALSSTRAEKRNLFTNLKKTLKTIGPFSGASSSHTAGTQFVRQQIRGQLAHDIWLLVLAVLIISCIEVSNFERDPVTYSVFNIVFEVVSGYGCVGISTGLPDQAYSFSGGWKTSSKLVLCAVMVRGRHRGLPVALDRAVRLPEQRGGEAGVGGEGWREEEDWVVRRSRSVRRASLV